MTRQIHSKQVIKEAQRAGFEVCDKSRGSHFKLRAPNGESMTCVHGMMSTGVSCKIIKWLKGFGILLAFIMGMLAYLYC